MSQNIPTVKFVDQAVPCPQDHKCPVCLDDEVDAESGPFVVHQKATVIDANGRKVTYDGDKHPFHKNCVKEWLKRSNTCPTCKVNISNNFVSRREKVVHFALNSAANANAGAQQVEGPMIFGAATIAIIAAVELAGLRGAKDILAIGGCSYGIAALLFGLGWGSLGGADAASNERISSTALPGAIGGAIMGTIAWFYGQTQDSKLAQIVGIFAIAKSTGLIPTTLGLGIGAATGSLINSTKMFGKYAKEATAGVVGGAAALIVHTRQTHPAITALSARFAYVMGMLAATAMRSFGKMGTLMAAGAAAGGAAVIGSKLLTRAHIAYCNPNQAAAGA